MKVARPKISAQLVVALAVLVGISVTANAKKRSFKPQYKMEKCDCLGYSDNIPTFLSDLSGAEDIRITVEAKSLKAVEKKAQNMCVETYRNFASVSQNRDPNEVSFSGCHAYKSTRDGSWQSL